METGNNQTIKPKPKYFWRVFRIIILSVLLLIFAAIFAGFWFSDRIAPFVVAEINKSLKTEVAVNDIGFSFIRKFPFATLNFKGLLAHPVSPFAKHDTLMYAGNVFLMFNIMDVIDGNYNIVRAEINNAVINLQTDSKGNNNYEIWKEQKAKTTSSLNSKLENVVLKDVAITYRNAQTKNRIELNAEKTNFKGIFSNDRYNLVMQGGVFLKDYASNNTTYIAGRKLKFDVAVEVNNLQKSYTIEKANCSIEELALATTGELRQLPDGYHVDLSFNSTNANLTSLFSLLPKEQFKKVFEYEATGMLNIKASVNGQWSKSRWPLVTVNFSTGNSELRPAASSYSLRNISFKGFYTNKKNDVSGVDYLSLKDFNAMLGSNRITGFAEIENLQKPRVNLELNSSFDLEEVAGFYKPDTIEKIEGSLILNARFSGQPGSSQTYQSSGKAELKQVSVSLKNSPVSYKNFQGSLQLYKGELNINQVAGSINGNSIRLNGVVKNVINFFLKEQEPVFIDGSVWSDRINLESLIGKRTPDKSESGGFNPLLGFNLMLHVDEMVYKLFTANNITGTINLANNELTADNLKLKACGGDMVLNGSVISVEADSLLMACDARINKIDIAQLFKATGSFGQSNFTEKNIGGELTSQVQLATKWSNDLKINQNSIYAIAKVEIENGALTNVKSLKALSRFIKGTNFDNVRFETLRNTIEIKDRNIHFPDMDIHSSALNLSASGTHSFDNMVDYKIKVQLSELTGRKVKNMNTEFGTIEEDHLGQITLYLTMKGHIDNPTVAIDKKTVKENFKRIVSKEKQNLKELIRKEFGITVKDTVTSKPAPKKKEELQLDYDDE